MVDVDGWCVGCVLCLDYCLVVVVFGCVDGVVCVGVWLDFCCDFVGLDWCIWVVCVGYFGFVYFGGVDGGWWVDFVVFLMCWVVKVLDKKEMFVV